MRKPLHDAPETLDLFALLRSIERTAKGKPRIGCSAARKEELVRLGQPPFVAFPDSNVSFFGADGKGRLLVESRFLGLLGPQGALPLHTTYEAAHWAEMRDDAFARFLDVFNNRFQQLFFRSWSDARPEGQFDRPDEDRFAAYVGSAAGIGTPAFRNRGELDDLAKLSVAGLVAPAVKSAARLESLIAVLFSADVEIEQCVGMWLSLDRNDQTSLGGSNSALGSDALLGAAVFSLQDKFAIRLKTRTLADFESYLPGGRHSARLADAVLFYLGEILDYEIHIGLPEVETRQAQLGSFGRLGWTSWLKAKDRTAFGQYRWDCRYNPAERRDQATA
jgi:type VI secretion system protein ImpH